MCTILAEGSVERLIKDNFPTFSLLSLIGCGDSASRDRTWQTCLWYLIWFHDSKKRWINYGPDDLFNLFWHGHGLLFLRFEKGLDGSVGIVSVLSLLASGTKRRGEASALVLRGKMQIRVLGHVHWSKDHLSQHGQCNMMGIHEKTATFKCLVDEIPCIYWWASICPLETGVFHPKWLMLRGMFFSGCSLGWHSKSDHDQHDYPKCDCKAREVMRESLTSFLIQ